MIQQVGQMLIAWGTAAVFGGTIAALFPALAAAGMSPAAIPAGLAAIGVGGAMVAGGAAWKGAGAAATGGGGAASAATATPMQGPPARQQQSRVTIVNINDLVSDEPRSRKAARVARFMESEGFSFGRVR